MAELRPTVGRALHYYPFGDPNNRSPLAATVAYVHSDTCVNIGYLDPNGEHRSATSVRLLAPPQLDEEQVSLGENEPHCRWPERV